MKKAEVIRLHNPPDSILALEAMIEDLKANRVSDLVVVAMTDVPKDKQEELGCEFQFRKYWMGRESCFKTMGMLAFMNIEIYDYIINHGDE